MGKKTVYIVRHGETDFNRMNIVQGSGVDSDLNELGKRQGQAFYEAYKHIPFDKIYVSKLKRTHQSVKSFIDVGFEIVELEGLNEISWGIYEGKEHSKDFDQEYLQRVEDWKNGLLHIPISGGETPIDLNARQKPALEYILSHTEEQTVLICMHGRALKAFMCLLLNLPLSDMDTFEHRNLGLYLLEYEDGVFTLVKRNDHEHLKQVGFVEDIT
jgi:probable phosphoglycerate mutase